MTCGCHHSSSSSSSSSSSKNRAPCPGGGPYYTIMPPFYPRPLSSSSCLLVPATMHYRLESTKHGMLEKKALQLDDYMAMPEKRLLRLPSDASRALCFRPINLSNSSLLLSILRQNIRRDSSSRLTGRHFKYYNESRNT